MVKVILSVVLFLSICGNVFLINAETKFLLNPTLMEESGATHMVDLINPSYQKIYEQKQVDYKKFFLQNILYKNADTDAFDPMQEKNILSKLCYNIVGYKENQYPNYKQKTFGIKNYKLFGNFKVNEETNLIKNPTDLTLQDQENKIYKVFYIWKNQLDYVEQFEYKYGEINNLRFDQVISPTPRNLYNAISIEKNEDEGICLELEPIN